ncbi:MAG: chemotaxis protein CheW [Candidatus Kapaibacterium sp.]
MSADRGKHIDPETQEMLSSFVSEAFDSLDTNEPIVENLREENNSESVNAIFRVFHTLKGLSGFFEMYVINKVTHQAETLLDLMRKQNKAQSDEIISVIYTTFDFLRELLQIVSVEFTDQSGEEEADDMIIVLQDTLNKIENRTDDINEAEIIETDSELPETHDEPEEIPEVPLNEHPFIEEEAKEELQGNSEGLDDLISDDMLSQFLAGANELVELAENNLIVLEKDNENYEIVAETFGAVHSLKGNAGFMGFTEIEEIAMEMETILDSIRNRDLDIDENIVTILLSNLETIKSRIDDITDKKKSDKAGKREEKPVAAESTLEPEEKAEEAAHEETNEEIEVDSIEDDIESSEGGEVEDNEDGEEDENFSIENETEEVPQKVDKQPAKEAKPAPKPSARSASPKPAGQIQQMQRKDIRVETRKIDKLFDLVGELITIETMVTNNPDLKGLELPNFSKASNQLNKITRELQEITMSVRMMPLEGLFNKMKRLVRDVSLKMGKKVDFTVSGQETEMDKNVIDEIADPLVHILRNAIDHGVEKPQDRLAKGKAEAGNVSLKARYEGNEILIIIEDDGAGIERGRILDKAIEKELVSEEQAEKMTDKEVYLLIFEPGFSTAQQLTDISGRGVGMDVVKKNLEKLRGSVDIDSTAGKGSVFTLRIPLTLAIMEAMVLRVGDTSYALPILNVQESLKISKDNISRTMDGLEVVRVRNEMMPVIRLHELFNKKPEFETLDEGILIIIESRRKKVCVFADEIVGQQQAVIKGLTDYIGKVPGLTGCMITGDGSIGLILDIESLIDISETEMELV